MPDEAIALTLSKADAEVLLGVLSAERYNAEVERLQRSARADRREAGRAGLIRTRTSPPAEDESSLVRFCELPCVQIGPCSVIR